MTASSIAGTQSIERTIQLLKKVATHNTAGLTLAEAARQTGLKVPTVHRMLSCLAEQGLLVQRGSKKGYFLGMLAYELGLAASSHFHLRELCGPVLARISRVTGDTVFLTTRSGLDSVVIERKEGSYPIKVLTQTVGERRPLGSTAGGLALLAAMPCSESEDLITKNLHRLSGYGFLSEPVLRQMLQRARRLGFALNDGDLLVDVTGIGVAIPSDLGSPHAALSVVALSKRIDARRRREIVALLNEEGAKLRDTLAGEDMHRH